MARKRPKLRKSVMAEVLARDPYECAQCGWTHGDPVMPSPSRHWREPPAVWRLEFDHIYPYSLGGLGNADNLQLLCSGCNSRKGAKV